MTAVERIRELAASIGRNATARVLGIGKETVARVLRTGHASQVLEDRVAAVDMKVALIDEERRGADSRMRHMEGQRARWTEEARDRARVAATAHWSKPEERLRMSEIKRATYREGRGELARAAARRNGKETMTRLRASNSAAIEELRQAFAARAARLDAIKQAAARQRGQ